MWRRSGSGVQVELRRLPLIIPTLAAFANSRGGTILVGVNDDAVIVGATPGRRTLDKFANKLVQNTEPQLFAQVDSVELDERLVIAISVTTNRSATPIAAFGKHHVRVPGTTQTVRLVAKPIRVLGQEYAAGTSLSDLLPDPIAEMRPSGAHLREFKDMQRAIEELKRNV